MDLKAFRTLGRSGLVVSPLALGTMTFAAPGWGSADYVSKAVFNEYIGAGGNFIKHRRCLRWRPERGDRW